MFIALRKTPRSQPRTFRINWRNPITRGLIFAVPGVPGHYVDLVAGRRPTFTGTLGTTNTQLGRLGRFAGAEAVDWPAFTAAELATGTPATVAWLQQNTTQAGGDTIWHFHPNGSVEAFYVYQNPGIGSDYYLACGQGGSSGIAFSSIGGAFGNDVLERLMLVATQGLVNTTGSNWALWRGQNKLASTGAVAAGPGAATTVRMGALAGASEFIEAGLGQALIWNRALTDAEAASYQANPFQVWEGAAFAFDVNAPASVPFVATADAPIGLHGALSISANIAIRAEIGIAPVAPIAMVGALGISSTVDFVVKNWRIPTNAAPTTSVHVTILSGSGQTYAIVTQGRTTVNADGNIYFPAQGTIVQKSLAYVHNYDDDTETLSIYGGPCIATLVDVG